MEGRVRNFGGFKSVLRQNLEVTAVLSEQSKPVGTGIRGPPLGRESVECYPLPRPASLIGAALLVGGRHVGIPSDGGVYIQPRSFFFRR